MNVRTINPFIYGDPVSGSHFYGRNAILQRIHHWSGRTVHIVGMRRVGKTSLFYKLKETLQILFVNADVIHGNPDRLHRELIDVFWDKQEDDWPWLPLPDETQDFYDLLKKMDRTLRAHKENLWLFIDEAEGLMSLEKDHPQALSLLRDVMLRSRCLKFILSSAKVFSEISDFSLPSGLTSPFLNNLPPPLYLNVLTNAEAATLVTKNQSLDVPSRVIQSLMEYSGNHPYYLQYLCYHLWDKEPDPKLWTISPEEYSLTPQLNGLLRQDFEYLSPAERKILYAVATQKTLPKVDQAYLAGLLSLGYIRKVDKSLRIGNRFLETWLKSVYMDWSMPSMASDQKTLWLYEKDNISYDTKILREFISATFSNEELCEVIFSIPSFREIYGQISPDLDRTDLIRRLVNYAERKMLFDQFLDELHQRNPQQYDIFYGSEKTQSSIWSQKQSKEEKMADPYTITFALAVMEKTTEFLFGQAGEMLKEWRERRKKSGEKAASQLTPINEDASINDPQMLKVVLREQFANLEHKAELAAYEMQAREVDSLMTQIKNLHQNKLMYEEEAAKLPGLDDRIAIRKRIEEIDNQIAEKSEKMRQILEQLSHQKISVPALDE